MTCMTLAAHPLTSAMALRLIKLGFEDVLIETGLRGQENTETCSTQLLCDFLSSQKLNSGLEREQTRNFYVQKLSCGKIKLEDLTFEAKTVGKGISISLFSV